jgi:ATP-binding cassette, subfamily B, bacterial CvaB/MchF/RaxB
MCGPNSLFLVLSSTGYCHDYDQLCEQFNLTAEGVTVTQILKVAQGYGCHLQAYQMNFDDLQRVNTPAILHFKPVGGMGHFVVMLDVNKDTVLTIDPTTGKTTQLSRGSLQDVWSGVVICEAKSMILPS